MDTTPTLTATEVIERVRAARRTAQAAVEELELALVVGTAAPLPGQTRPRRTGARPTCTARP